MTRHVAIDLGASSGRVAVGRLEHGRLELEGVYRFSNEPISEGERLWWDIERLWQEVLVGLKQAAACGPIASVGVASWAVDFALLAGGQLLGGVRHYRDPRTQGVMEAAFATVPKAALFAYTGLQFQPFNTLYQLLALRRDEPPALDSADTLLLVPDLFHYRLCGRAVAERTNASTTQLYDPQRGDWSAELIDAFGLPRRLFPEIVAPGTVLGPLAPEVVAHTGLEGTLVVAPATHDTASAVAAVPAEGEGWAYISSGTWSLVGVELLQPLVTPAALDLNVTNEAGVAGTRLIKNVTGLWILQECRRAWGEPRYATLYREAEAVPSPGVYIDPDDMRFALPAEEMPELVRAYCLEAGQALPEGRGAVTRCLLESLARRYGEVIGGLERLTGKHIETVHIIGGGSQIGLLNRLTAEATGKRVLAGPADATLMGNLLVQAAALGAVPLAEVRRVVRASSDLAVFEPTIGGN